MLRFIIAAILIGAGVFIFAVATIGVYKFKYVLNRMQVAAQSDTLGLHLICSGTAGLLGFTFATQKVVLVVILFWLTGPLSSHMVAKMELHSQDEDDKDKFEKVFEKGVEEDD